MCGGCLERVTPPSTNANVHVIATITANSKRFVHGHVATFSSFTSRIMATALSSFELEGHTSFVTALAGHPFLPLLVSGSCDETVRVWDLGTRRCVCTLEGHTDSVFSVAIDFAGRRLVSGSWDCSIKLWDLDSGVCLGTLTCGEMDVVSAVAWDCCCSGALVASGSVKDGRVRVWDTATGALRHTLEGHSDVIGALVSHPTDDLFASASADKTVRVWRWSSGESVDTLEGHTTSVRSLAASAAFIVSGSADKTVRVWSWTTGLCVRVIDGFATPLCGNSLAWRDSTLVVREETEAVHMWDTSAVEDPTSWSCVRSLPPTKSHFSLGVAVTHHDQRTRVATSNDTKIAVWECVLED